jgi:ketosteroid isomerase-like protein
MAEDQAKGQRTVVERASIRWPRMARRTARSVLRLPPGSRPRNAMLRRAAEIAFLAWNRGDFALVPNIDDPEVETHMSVGSDSVPGLDAIYYGPEGHCRAMELWNEAWQKWDAEIDEVIEEGRDRVVIVARVHAVGAASGIRLDEWGAVRYSFREGRILRVQGAFDPSRDRALELLAEEAG